VSESAGLEGARDIAWVASSLLLPELNNFESLVSEDNLPYAPHPEVLGGTARALNTLSKVDERRASDGPGTPCIVAAKALRHPEKPDGATQGVTWAFIVPNISVCYHLHSVNILSA